MSRNAEFKLRRLCADIYLPVRKPQEEDESSESDRDADSSDSEPDPDPEPTPDNSQESLPLYPGANITKEATDLRLLQFTERHQLSNVAIEDLLELFGEVLPQPNNVTTSRYLLEKPLDSYFPDHKREKFCTEHNIILDADDTCLSCQVKVDTDLLSREEMEAREQVFFTWSIEENLKSLFQLPEFRELLGSQGSIDGLDLTEGFLFKKRDFHRYADVSLSFFIDGAPVHANSRMNTMWVVWAFVNNIPLKHRQRFGFMVSMCLSWKQTPPDILYQSAVSELVSIYLQRGCEIHGRRRRIELLAVLADSPAKCKSQGIAQFNGKYFSCGVCEISGRQLDRIIVFPFTGEEAPLRTHASILAYNQQRLAAMNHPNKIYRRHIKQFGFRGVKRLTELARLGRTFDIVRGHPADAMHIIKNVMGTFLTVLCTVPLRTLPFHELRRADKRTKKRFILDDEVVDQLNTFFGDVAYPGSVNRLPRYDITQFALYKASENLNLLLTDFAFLSGENSVVRRSIDPEIFHLIRTLCGFFNILFADRYDAQLDNWNPSTAIIRRADQADILIRDFLLLATEVFGEKYITSNFHSMLHLPNVYRDFGPLYGTSNFMAEDFIRIITAIPKGTIRVDVEIINKWKRKQALMRAVQPSATKKSMEFKGAVQQLVHVEVDENLRESIQQYVTERNMCIKGWYRRAVTAKGYRVDSLMTSEKTQTPRHNSFWTIQKSSRIIEVHGILQTATSAGKDHALVFGYERLCMIAKFSWTPMKGKGKKEWQTLEFPRLFLSDSNPKRLLKKPVVVDIHLLEQPLFWLRNNKNSAVRFAERTFTMPFD